MRRLVRFALPFVIAAFWVSVAGAAAAPYYGAVSDFVHNAAVSLPLLHGEQHVSAAGRSPTAGVSAFDGTQVATVTPTPRRSTTPAPHATKVPGHPTPTQSRLAAAVQRLARSSKVPRRRINILVLGSDNDTKFSPGAMPPTQVIIVLSIDPVSNTVTMLSIPRDFWVHIPGYQYNVGPDGTVGWNKIDIASFLGFNSSACTVERNFGIPIDHWIWVGLKGFMRVIDTTNGVTLDVTHPVIDDTYPDDLADPNNPFAYRRIYIPPGPQHLNGDAALHFVRSRHGDVQGDFGRSARQQIVLSQLRRVLLSQNGAELVALVPQLLRDFHDEIKTDIAPDLSSAAYYFSLFQTVSNAKINQVVLGPPYSDPEYYVPDTDPSVEAVNGGQPLQIDAVLPNWPLISQKITELFGGQYFDQTPHCS